MGYTNSSVELKTECLKIQKWSVCISYYVLEMSAVIRIGGYRTHKIYKSERTWKPVIYLFLVFLWNHNTLKANLDLAPNYVTISYCALLFKWLFSQLIQRNTQIQKNFSGLASF